ncbi:MAG: sulfite exporter TauE/SafE family protein [Rhizobiaceae bacterium]
MESLLALVDLTGTEFTICTAVIFIAGMVRGFSGFALSAVVMAALVSILPPVELIAICWFLEFTASLFMVRGGIKDYDKFTVYGLVVGSASGAPIGYYLTNTLPIETSKIIALVIILVLAVLQLLKVRASILATKPGVILSGITAGIAAGLAGVGGMMTALYVLARDSSVETMRGSLIMYLFMMIPFGLFYQIYFGLMDIQAVIRGLIWVPVSFTGVIAGNMMFSQKYAPYYKPFCLALLMVLAAVGLARMVIA